MGCKRSHPLPRQAQVDAALGEHGLAVEVVEQMGAWKHSSREGAHAGGDLYLRRHYYKLRMSDGTVWTVYFVRQSPKSGSAKNRWFLYTIEDM